MVENIVGLGENHRNDADELEADLDIDHTVGVHKLDDGVPVEERRKAILKDVTRNRFGAGASKIRLAKSMSRKILLPRGASTTASEAERERQKLASGTLSPQPSSLDSPAKASRQPDAKMLTSETGTREVEVVSGRLSPTSRRGIFSCSSDIGSFRSTVSSPTQMSASFFDARLKMLQESMGQWGCGPRSIFGLHEVFGPDLLFFMLESAFREFDLFEHFSIDAQKLQSLCSAIVDGYNDLPYHNYIHGMDVTHGTYWLLKQRLGSGASGGNRMSVVGRASAVMGEVTGRGSGAVAPARAHEELWESIPKYAVCAGLLAAAIHDVNHDGFNNAFHVATGSDLAMTYNDKSCLESMHASIGLQLIRHPNNDVLEHMSLEQKRKFRTLSVDMIMGTDLANHFEGVSQLQVRAHTPAAYSGPPSRMPLPPMRCSARACPFPPCVFDPRPLAWPPHPHALRSRRRRGSSSAAPTLTSPC